MLNCSLQHEARAVFIRRLLARRGKAAKPYGAGMEWYKPAGLDEHHCLRANGAPAFANPGDGLMRNTLRFPGRHLLEPTQSRRFTFQGGEKPVSPVFDVVAREHLE